MGDAAGEQDGISVADRISSTNKSYRLDET
jgi:hypothetical protein